MSKIKELLINCYFLIIVKIKIIKKWKIQNNKNYLNYNKLFNDKKKYFV